MACLSGVSGGGDRSAENHLFKKILIANRGEIACRIIKSARGMNIATVAIASDADGDALHVEMADEYVVIGPPPAAESYLDIDKVIAAALESGAEAIHPGYGFLSENAAFVGACEKAGLVFIGPPASAIASMGDKITARRLAADAGVSILPGSDRAVGDIKAARRIAREIGYPVMIKASSGGGGKGMRIARDDDELAAGMASAASEATAAFGDGRVFIEKYIEKPRHIEIQVLGDQAGNIIHLGERECSIQRRHQKVIEEAPSPRVDEAMRQAMAAQAIGLARAAGYYSAGTVEFIVDREGDFYFLEMNTRLQVEHPVTEAVTGIDLVAAMIRIAVGEPLGVTQQEVTLSGWAIEARLYAEDPYRGFMPAIGRLSRYRPPAEEPGVRVDSGVFEGSEISLYYDPMIAKLITRAEDRERAVEKMAAALDAFYLRGVANNVPFLSAVMAHPRFRAGDIDTGFIDAEYKGGFAGGALTDQLARLFAATALFLHGRETLRNGDIWNDPRKRQILIDGRSFAGEVSRRGDNITLAIDGRTLDLDCDWQPGQPVAGVRPGQRQWSIEVDMIPLGYRLMAAGVSVCTRVLRPAVAALYGLMPEKKRIDTSRYLLSPMPGLVTAIAVEADETVKAGQIVAIVEAMKMENNLRAPRDGVIARVAVAVGDSIAADDIIVEFEAD